MKLSKFGSKVILTHFIFLVYSVTSKATLADFSGTWVGLGSVTSTFGVKGKCSSLEIEIQQTPNELRVNRYHAACDLLDTDWGPSSQQIRDGKLYESGEEVGSIYGTSAVSSAADSGVLYILNLKKVSDTELNVTYGTQNFVGTITIEGPLHRK